MWTQFVQGYTHHPYHIVTSSVWPFACSLSINSGLYFFLWYHFYSILPWASLYALAPLNFVAYAYFWWKDIEKEGAYEGSHDAAPQLNLKMGVMLFIVSEVMFFFSFFWAFFHFSLSPSVELNVWPPQGIETLDFTCLPLLNTLLLVLSGSAITYAHHFILSNQISHVDLVQITLYVIVCALLFTGFQAQEYFQSTFEFSDSAFGSIFFLATGFHGIHVLVGTFFILYNVLRMTARANFTVQHHLGFEFAIWYWHFVDLVWLFLYTFVYCWSA